MNNTKVVKLAVDKWFVDKGFAFGEAPTGEIVFIHASVVQSAEALVVGTDAWAQVASDQARAEGGHQARRAWGRNVWRQERDKEKANRVASKASSSADGRTGSSVREEDRRGMRPAAGPQ